MADNDDDAAWERESHRSTIEFALSGIKALLLANGGAAVALLTFAGSAATGARGLVDLEQIAGSLLFFAWGLAAAIVCSLTSYLAQSLYTPRTKLGNRLGTAAHGLALITALLSLGLFIFGVTQAATAFQR